MAGLVKSRRQDHAQPTVAPRRTDPHGIRHTSGHGSLKVGSNFSVSVHCDSLDEIERLFSALGRNGNVRMPLGNMPWGSRLGMLSDQFGIQWLFNGDLPSEGSGS